jgi:hypothetical protein
MALRVMSMAEIWLEVLLEAARSGETVTEVCRRHGICRKTRYLSLSSRRGPRPRAPLPPARGPTGADGIRDRAGDLPPAQRPSALGSTADPGRASGSVVRHLLLPSEFRRC